MSSNRIYSREIPEKNIELVEPKWIVDPNEFSPDIVPDNVEVQKKYEELKRKSPSGAAVDLKIVLKSLFGNKCFATAFGGSLSIGSLFAFIYFKRTLKTSLILEWFMYPFTVSFIGLWTSCRAINKKERESMLMEQDLLRLRNQETMDRMNKKK